MLNIKDLQSLQTPPPQTPSSLVLNLGVRDSKAGQTSPPRCAEWLELTSICFGGLADLGTVQSRWRWCGRAARKAHLKCQAVSGKPEMSADQIPSCPQRMALQPDWDMLFYGVGALFFFGLCLKDFFFQGNLLLRDLEGMFNP